MEHIENALKNMITLPSNTKENTGFHVSYLNMPENISNLLGRQTIGFTPPSIEVELATWQQRRHPVQDVGRIMKTPINVSLRCDDIGYVEGILLNQMLIQENRTRSSAEKDRSESFDLQVVYYDQTGKESQKLIYRRCKITLITLPSSRMTSDKVPLEVEVMMMYDTMEFYSSLGELLADI